MLLALILTCSCLTPAASYGEATGKLPKVRNADIPFYPWIPRAAYIQGTVELRVSTDGEKAAEIVVLKGQPMLAEAAKRNVSSWRFEPHEPATFNVAFQYKILPSNCDEQTEEMWAENVIVVRLPSEVRVSAKEVIICEPVTNTPRQK